MTVSKAQKDEIFADLIANFGKSCATALVQNNRMTVEEVNKLRKAILAAKGRMLVAKKTLIALAFEKVTGQKYPDAMLEGQIAVIFSFEDAIAPFAAAKKIASEIETPEAKNKVVFMGSYYDSKIQDAQTTTKLASLPSREVLLARMLGSLQSPASSLARFLDAAKKKMSESGKNTLAETIG